MDAVAELVVRLSARSTKVPSLAHLPTRAFHELLVMPAPQLCRLGHRVDDIGTLARAGDRANVRAGGRRGRRASGARRCASFLTARFIERGGAPADAQLELLHPRGFASSARFRSSTFVRVR